MMDPSNLLLADGLETVHQNGVHEELSFSGKDNGVSNVDPSVTEIIEPAAPNGNVEIFNQSDSTATDNSSMAEIKEGSSENNDGNNITISKEEEAKVIDQTKQLGIRKGPVKNKNVKPPSPRGVHATSVKKNKDKKDDEAASAVSNGTFASDSLSHPRQPVNNRSLNDKQTRLSKHPGKSDAAPSEAPTEKTRPRLLKKAPRDTPQGEEESSSPTADDAKPRRVGALPNYGFSFKCDERAARRKEFYSKLEEKIQAKEEEESNLHAKTKETQDAEIKLLRKSLAFKATPLPSFYQEPPPPQVELKKIPTTRAKSPKLGRRKTSTHSESERTTNSSTQPGRLSLDEKVSQSNPTKGTSPVNQRKPQRRSLPPRLNPERISSSKSATARTPSKAVNDEKASLSSVTTEVTSLPIGEEKIEMAEATEENAALSEDTKEALHLKAEPGEVISHVNGDIVIEEKPELASVQEPIVAEN